MKTLKLITIALLFLSTSVFAQFPSHVSVINAVPNKVTSVQGNLNQGKIISDLSWASQSSVACFPGTQNSKFNGNHVLYATKIPPYSEMFITVEPENTSDNFSIYAYQIGTTSYATVPDLSSCVTCEATHKWDYPKRGKTQDHTRTVRLNAIRNPYNVVIGVVGANGLANGAYTLKIDLKSKKETGTQQPLKMYRAPSEKGKVKAYSGDLSEGVKMNDLSWASKSSVACFPATQNKKFNGNHIIFLTDLPARSVMKIQVIPENKNANMSLWAYSTGTTSKAMVPNLSSCVSCEADHKWDYPKRGKTQDHTRSVELNAINNPYRVVIGVAGANGATSGKFVLRISVE